MSAKRIGRRKSDIWRYRLNQILGAADILLLIALIGGCEKMRAFIMGFLSL